MFKLIHIFEMNPTVPNMTGYDEVKIIMTSLPVPDEFLFFQAYFALSVCMYFFLSKTTI